jgi:hypothetical protein
MLSIISKKTAHRPENQHNKRDAITKRLDLSGQIFDLGDDRLQPS